MLNAYFPFGAANSLAFGRAGCNRLPPRERQPRQAPPGLAAFTRSPVCACWEPLERSNAENFRSAHRSASALTPTRSSNGRFMPPQVEVGDCPGSLENRANPMLPMATSALFFLVPARGRDPIAELPKYWQTFDR